MGKERHGKGEGGEGKRGDCRKKAGQSSHYPPPLLTRTRVTCGALNRQHTQGSECECVCVCMPGSSDLSREGELAPHSFF